MKKIAIVTGASSGMGKEFVKLLCRDKSFQLDEIWLMARRGKLLKQVVKEIKESVSDGEKIPDLKDIEVDLSGKSGVSAFKALLDAEKLVNEKYDGFVISVMINNAGFGTYGTFEETPLERELEMIDLNCTTLTGLAGLSLQYMKEGSILINTASLASFLPLGNFAVYGATKAYALSFSMGLAAEVKDKGIKVCALCPGPVSTDFANVASNGARKEVRHGLPADKVAAHCLKRAKKGKHTAIYAFKWKFKAFASRFVGKFFGAWFTYKYCKRPVNHN